VSFSFELHLGGLHRHDLVEVMRLPGRSVSPGEVVRSRNARCVHHGFLKAIRTDPLLSDIEMQPEAVSRQHETHAI
jgi:hypothetical protein